MKRILRQETKAPQEGASWARGVIQAAREAAGIVRSYPSTLICPLFILGVILGFGLWGVTRMVKLEEISTKERAQNLVHDAATWLRSLILSSSTPVQLIAAMVGNSPQYPDARDAFLSVAPILLAQELYNSTKRINLLPNGVIEETYPATEDHKRALGLDIFQAVSGVDLEEVLKAVRDNATTLAGPLELAEGGRGLVIRHPVFVSGITANESFQSPAPLSANCGAPCNYNVTSRTKFWGFVTSVVDFDMLTERGDSRLVSLDKLGYRYEVSVLGKTAAKTTEVLSSTSPPLNPVEAVVELPNSEWVIRVSPWDGWRPNYYPGLVAAVVVVAIAVSWLVFVVLLARRRHQMLLEALLPKKIIENLDAAALSSNTRREPDTPANTLLEMMGLLLEGRIPELQDVLFIRTALLRNVDVYQPINIKGHFKGANLDAEVERALMQQLVGGSLDTGSGAAAAAAAPDGGPATEVPPLRDPVQAPCPATQSAAAKYDLASTAGAMTFVLSADAAPWPISHHPPRGAAAGAAATNGNPGAGVGAGTAVNAGIHRDAPPPSLTFLGSALGRAGSSPLSLHGLGSPFRFPISATVGKSRLRGQGGSKTPRRTESAHQSATSATDASADAGALDETDCAVSMCGDACEEPSLLPPILLAQRAKRNSACVGHKQGSRAAMAQELEPDPISGVCRVEQPQRRHTVLVQRPLSALMHGGGGSKLKSLVFGRGSSMEGSPSADGSLAVAASGQPARLVSRSSAMLLKWAGSESQSAGAHCDAAEPPPVPRPPINMQQVERLLATSDAWQFDTWALNEATQGHALSVLGFFLVKRSGLIDHFGLSPVRLARFLRQVEAGYLDNPYHNAVHAADVLQTLHVVIHAAQLHVHYLDKLGLLAAYIAAMVHDYAHPGLTGDFLIACAHPLAILYNDHSPLENHHCAASFNLLQRPDLDVLAPLAAPERAAFRKQVIDLVLATDMKQHFSILSHFNTVHRVSNYSQKPGNSSTTSVTKTTSGGRLVNVHAEYNEFVSNGDLAVASTDVDTAPKPVDDTERLLSLQVVFKCADIGHLGEALEVHKRWLCSLEEEFYLQGDRERDLGLPISPLFDRSKQGVSKSQVGFYDFVALPLVHAMTSAFPGAQPLMRCLLENYHHWRRSAWGAAQERSQSGSTAPKE